MESEMIERVARALALRQGDDFDKIAKDKGDWTENRGTFGGRFRDVNELKQTDYLELASAAIEAMTLQDLLNEIDRRFKAGTSEPGEIG